MNPVNAVEVSNNPVQWILVVVLNLLVLAELCIAMYLAAADPENLTAVFMKSFFAMLVPTLVIAVIVRRRLGSAR